MMGTSRIPPAPDRNKQVDARHIRSIDSFISFWKAPARIFIITKRFVTTGHRPGDLW